MKKYFLLFAAGGLLTLASCGGENTPTETINVDSLAQVKVDSIAAAEKAISDSTIAAQALITADSLRMVMREDSIAAAAAKAAGRKAPAKKVVPKKAAEVIKEETATPKSGGLRGSSDQNTQGGLRSNSDQNKQGGGLRSNSDQNREK